MESGYFHVALENFRDRLHQRASRLFCRPLYRRWVVRRYLQTPPVLRENSETHARRFPYCFVLYTICQAWTILPVRLWRHQGSPRTSWGPVWKHLYCSTPQNSRWCKVFIFRHFGLAQTDSWKMGWTYNTVNPNPATNAPTIVGVGVAFRYVPWTIRFRLSQWSYAVRYTLGASNLSCSEHGPWFLKRLCSNHADMRNSILSLIFVSLRIYVRQFMIKAVAIGKSVSEKAFLKVTKQK
jgi:hypothetical protein